MPSAAATMNGTVFFTSLLLAAANGAFQ